MKNKTGRYSGYIRPFTYLVDLILINLFAYLLLSDDFHSFYFASLISISWIIIALNIGFYEVYRFTKVVSILEKVIKQFTLFTLICFAFSGFYIQNYNSKLLNLGFYIVILHFDFCILIFELLVHPSTSLRVSFIR